MKKLAVLTLFILNGCGWLTLGGGNGDAPVGGTIKGSGVLVGQSGATVSGSVTIYQQSDPTTYIVRLEGLSVSGAPGGLFVVGTLVDSSTPLSTSLRSTTGNQNYTATASATASWSKVTLYLPGNLTTYATTTGPLH